MPSTSEARYAVFAVVAAIVAWGAVDGLVAALDLAWRAVASDLPVRALVLGVAVLGLAGAIGKVGLLLWGVLRDPQPPSPVALVGLIGAGLLGWAVALAHPMVVSLWMARQLPADQLTELYTGTGMAAWLAQAVTHTGLLLALGLAYWRARHIQP